MSNNQSSLDNPSDLRSLFRDSKLICPTSGLAAGYVQTNLAILPKKYAFDFLLFCQRNPKPCPLIEVIEAGKYTPIQSAPYADIRYDVPQYRIYENGTLSKEVDNIADIWTDELVTFLFGCSFSFEEALIESGINLSHFENKKNVSMFITNINTIPAGVFSGPTVVSMRAIPRDKLVKTIQVTSRFPNVHGAPIHIGNPEQIGIKDINSPDFGDINVVNEDEVPVFWACGVTPQAVAMKSKPPLMITHSPGHMFVTDIKNHEVAVI
ncbi:MAG: DUF1445 domain-containing protein [Chloroflexi bacterium]|nr:DUF1445 domain-containing protein [Chloroflexota bacterium]|tara:strand:- start:6338 stop:7135 length:798 start_codon:yes stop_codon:yes gene_type:complete